MKPSRFDVVVAGGGPAGLAAALALARVGLHTCLAAAPHRPGGQPRDRRTAALFTGSIDFLHNLGVWDELNAATAPLRAIRLIDDTGGLLKAPEITFRAEEAGLDAFGYNVPNDALVEALTALVKRDSAITVMETAGVKVAEITPESIAFTLPEGPHIEARLAAAADGRASRTRAAAGITTTSWSYPQTALVTWFAHQRDHEGVSSEFHRASGPFTTVPMPGRVSSLVWVEAHAEVARLMEADDTAFRRAIETRLQGLLGTVGEIGPRAAFPLSGLTPDVFARNRVALVGEAGHVIPPIGAQGLNLGLRDAAALADCAAQGRAQSADPGHPGVMDRYSRWRAPDVHTRITTVDLLNRTLLSPLLPVHLMRGLGLHLIRTLSPLRRTLLREGVQPSGELPTLMQPQRHDRRTFAGP